MVGVFTFEYRFNPKSFDDEFLEDFNNSLGWFMASLEKNGQILSYGQNTAENQDSFTSLLVTPEKDSLDEKYFNKYCDRYLNELLEKSSQPPKYELVGNTCDVMDICDCEDSSHYIVFTTCLSYEPPVICGDCLNPVPLYKFPKTYDDSEYYDLLGWQDVYQVCDKQFLNGIGEKHGYYMMHNPKSALSIEGLRICRCLEEKTNKRFFYFLFNYYSKNKPACPNCGEDWVNHDEVFNYDYVCQRCRLVSNKSSRGY